MTSKRCVVHGTTAGLFVLATALPACGRQATPPAPLVPSASPVASAAAPGSRFEHRDWELACDNTRTCRAAGYQPDGGEGPLVSVLLTRAAGPGTPVRGELALGEDIEDEVENPDDPMGEPIARPDPTPLLLYVDGRPRSPVPVLVPKDTLRAALPAAQVAALLTVLGGRAARIEWGHGAQRWRLSGAGATAVLLRMDDLQGRLGTRGALVRKGPRDERSVPPPLPAPVVTAVAPAPPREGDAQFVARHGKDLLDALRTAATLPPAGTAGPDTGECGLIDDDDVRIAAERLTDTQFVVTAPCWQAAYNSGDGVWIVADAPGLTARLVVTDATTTADGSIEASQKGRGPGDCRSEEEWVWDGTHFVHTGSSTTGLCRGMPGGFWDLPVLVATVRPFARPERRPVSRVPLRDAAPLSHSFP